MKDKKWTPEDEEFLIKNYPTVDNKTLSKQLNRTGASLIRKAKRLGIQKNKDYIDGYKRNPKIKYNYIDLSFDELKKIALKYKTKTEFSRSDKSAHQKARRFGKNEFNEICSHMIDQQFSLPQLIMKYVLNKLLKERGQYNTREVISPYELDLYYKKYKLAFEYDGKKWHEDNDNDEIKNDICRKAGITLIRIKERNKDNHYQDVSSQIIEHIDIINKISNSNITKEDVMSIEYNGKDIFAEILDEDSIKKTISKYNFYKDFRANENALYMKLKRRKLLKIYTSELIRDKNDKYRNRY